MFTENETTRPVTSAPAADDAQTRPEESQVEKSESSDFASETYKNASSIKTALKSGVANQGKVTKWLSSATAEDMKVLGLLMTGSKNEQERKLLNDLVRKARKAGNLPSENDLDNQIYTFKDGGLATTKKPTRKETASEPVIEQTIEPAKTIEVPDFMTEFQGFIALMSRDELIQAQALIEAKLATMPEEQPLAEAA